MITSRTHCVYQWLPIRPSALTPEFNSSIYQRKSIKPCAQHAVYTPMYQQVHIDEMQADVVFSCQAPACRNVHPFTFLALRDVLMRRRTVFDAGITIRCACRGKGAEQGFYTFELDPHDGQMVLLSVVPEPAAGAPLHGARDLLYTSAGGEVQTWSVCPETGRVARLGAGAGGPARDARAAGERSLLVADHRDASVSVLSLCPESGRVVGVRSVADTLGRPLRASTRRAPARIEAYVFAFAQGGSSPFGMRFAALHSKNPTDEDF